MNSPKPPSPSPSYPPPASARGPGAVSSIKAGSRPNPMAGKIRDLVERHPVEATEVLRRWLGDRGGGD